MNMLGHTGGICIKAIRLNFTMNFSVAYLTDLQLGKCYFPLNEGQDKVLEQIS